ncbi:MAG: alpha/beta fold hydrolase [Sphingomonas sp.]
MADDGERAVAGAIVTKPRGWLAAFGLILILAGAWLASAIQTSGGISVSDIRFRGASGTKMSATLYVPPGIDAQHPAPGILAVHGYINSRETQDAFAIEFARRGYVVLALDQTGHGASGGKAFANWFGGPDGLAYLRSLPFVDRNQIGLEGHSMGGWTVLAAAAAMPDAYRSIVLEGSSTGAPFAKDGDPTWPRNLALVYSRYDEFSKLMWNSDRAIDVPNSAKLRAVFGTAAPIITGQIYGSVDTGTARVLYQPNTTHPGDHISRVAIGHALDWFATTLKGGRPLPTDDQIWYWKEFGTGIGLIGFVALIAAAFDLLSRSGAFHTARGVAVAGAAVRDARWRRGLLLTTIVPALLFFPAFIAGALGVPPFVLLPQGITNQVVLWALLSGAAGLALARFGPPLPPRIETPWLLAIGLAVATVAIGYAVLIIFDRLFLTDLRFWVIGLRVPTPRQALISCIYVGPFTLAFAWSLGGLRRFAIVGESRVAAYGTAAAASALGITLMLAIIYGLFFATGTLVTGFDPLSTVVALQFVPILIVVALLATFAWRRTGSYRPGAVLVGLLVTLYVCAGTATHAWN